MAERILDPWGARTPYPRGGDWPIRVDENLDGSVDEWVQSACVLCSHGCALDIGVRDGRIVGVRGRGTDRVNHGRLGPKGLFGWQANNSSDRLLHPLVRRERRIAESDLGRGDGPSSSSAPGLCSRPKEAARSASTRAVSSSSRTTTRWRSSRGAGSERIISMATRGSAPRRQGSRSRRRSAATASRPGSTTSSTATRSCTSGINTAETQTVLWMHELDRLRGPDPPRSIVIDPRQTESAREADVHLAIKPGTNLAILNGLAQQLIETTCRPGVHRAAHGRPRRARTHGLRIHARACRGDLRRRRRRCRAGQPKSSATPSAC